MVTATTSDAPSDHTTPTLAPSTPLSPTSDRPARASSDSAAAANIASPPPLEASSSAPLPTAFTLPALHSTPIIPPVTPSTPTPSIPSSPSPSVRKPKLVDGLLHSSCHQCKTTKVHHLVLSCHAKADPLRKARQCRKKYCSVCLSRTYGVNLQAMTKKELDEWICPSCHDACCCAACKRMKEKAYSEQMMKITTQTAMIQQSQAAAQHHHNAAGVPLPSQQQQQQQQAGSQAELQRVKSLTDALITASAAPPPQDTEDAASAALHYQLQQLQHLHQMQQLQQTLTLLQALSNKAATTAPDALSAPVSSVASPVHRGVSGGVGLQLPGLSEGSLVDDTFGHQLHLRIAALRHQQLQEQDRGGKVEPIDVHLTPSISTSAVSTPNEALTHPTLMTLTLPTLPRAASHPTRSVPVSPSHGPPAPISMDSDDGGEVDYGAIANKLMTAASLATRIFQEQRSGKQQQMYQQQCRLQQQTQTGGYEGHQQQPQPQQQHGPPVVPLSLSASSFGPTGSSLTAHASFLSQQRGELDGYASSNLTSPRTSMPAHAQYNDVEYATKLSEREELHRLQMSILQERQRAQLQQLLHTQERIRMHAKDSSDDHSGSVAALGAPSPPPKRQCHNVGSVLSAGPSDAMQQLQAKVEALQVEQRRLAMQEERDHLREQANPTAPPPPPPASDSSDMFTDLSPGNFLSDPWGKFPSSTSADPAERSLSVSSRWPLEDVEEEEEANMMRRVI